MNADRLRELAEAVRQRLAESVPPPYPTSLDELKRAQLGHYGWQALEDLAALDAGVLALLDERDEWMERANRWHRKTIEIGATNGEVGLELTEALIREDALRAALTALVDQAQLQESWEPYTERFRAAMEQARAALGGSGNVDG